MIYDFLKLMLQLCTCAGIIGVASLPALLLTENGAALVYGMAGVALTIGMLVQG